MGTAVGSKVFTEHGWRADASLNLAWTGWSLFVLFLRGPHCPRYTWIGWQGGFELRKSKVLEWQQREREVAAASAINASEDEKTHVKTTQGQSRDIAEEKRVNEAPGKDERRTADGPDAV